MNHEENTFVLTLSSIPSIVSWYMKQASLIHTMSGSEKKNYVLQSMLDIVENNAQYDNMMLTYIHECVPTMIDHFYDIEHGYIVNLKQTKRKIGYIWSCFNI